MRIYLSLILGLFISVVAQAQAQLLPHESKTSTEGLAIINGCSGGVVRFAGQSESSRALVITNGHCLWLNLNMGKPFPYPVYGEVLRNISDQNFLSKTNITLNGLRGGLQVQARRLIYATMTGTDLALFELNETYQELKSKMAIPHFEVSEELPRVGEPISIRSGLYARKFDCTYEGQVTLLEGPFFTKPALAFSKPCDIYPGYSGSLIFSEKTGKVFGVANTHANKGKFACEFDHPCLFSDKTHQVKAPFAGQSFGAALNKSIFKQPTSQTLSLFPADQSLTSAEMNLRMSRFKRFADPILNARGVALEYLVDNDWQELLGAAAFFGDKLEISVGSRLFENPKVTADSLDLILCHELGHFMGAAPKKKNGLNSAGDWASAEGESDYFAGSCLANLWSQQLNATFQLNTWESEARCTGLQSIIQRQLCERIARAGVSFYGMLYDVYSKVGAVTGPRPHVDQQDASVVPNTLMDYPSHQCRLDSVIAGAMKKARPSCWNGPARSL